MRRRHPQTGHLAIAAVLVLAVFGISAAPLPVPAIARSAAARSRLCIPIVMKCDQPSPEPSPSDTPPPDQPSQPPQNGERQSPAPQGTPTEGPSPAPTAQQDAEPDPGAPTFTLPAAQLGGSSLSFTGIPTISIVTVPLANGGSTPVLKLTANTITIDDFMLDVRKATGPALVTDAGQMQLSGHVHVYLDSLTASLPDGRSITLGAATPPPGDELPETMLRVNLGLVGVTADSISLVPSHQNLQ